MGPDATRIAELAATISKHTTIVDNHLREHSLPPLSFDENSPVDRKFPQEVEQSRFIAVEATQELKDLLAGPKEILFNHHHNQLVYLHFISHYRIAHIVPINGEISYEALASATGVNESSLARILRLAIAHRIFKEVRPGVIAHTAASRAIAEDPHMADWVGANVEEMWPSAMKLVEALVKWPEATEPNQTGFSLAHTTQDPFYLEMAKSPERARRFGGAMSLYTKGEGFSLHHLTDNYPWGSLEAGTVVDLGGSHGDAAFAISRKFPDLKLIVQDLSETVAGCNEQEGLDVTFMVHDFFEEQPVKHADLYLFRWILHNWPEEYCIRVLRALIPALKTGARILVMDIIMPPPNVLPNGLERQLRAMDVTMMEIANAKERHLPEWEKLFSQADTRFKFKGATQPQGSKLGLIEAMWQG